MKEIKIILDRYLQDYDDFYEALEAMATDINRELSKRDAKKFSKYVWTSSEVSSKVMEIALKELSTDKLERK